MVPPGVGRPDPARGVLGDVQGGRFTRVAVPAEVYRQHGTALCGQPLRHTRKNTAMLREAMNANNTVSIWRAPSASLQHHPDSSYLSTFGLLSTSRKSRTACVVLLA